MWTGPNERVDREFRAWYARAASEVDPTGQLEPVLFRAFCAAWDDVEALRRDVEVMEQQARRYEHETQRMIGYADRMIRLYELGGCRVDVQAVADKLASKL